MADPRDPVTPAQATPVIDRRPVPPGVLPRGVQTWLMAALAIVILLVIVLTGHRDAPEAPEAVTAPAGTTSPDRVRAYQDRLRLLEAQARVEAEALPALEPALPPAFEDDAISEVSSADDPVAADRARREYDSLFASNVVVSRRLEGSHPDGRPTGGRDAALWPSSDGPPSLDAIADAVVRATRGAAPGAVRQTDAGQAVTPTGTDGPPAVAASAASTPSLSSPYRVLEGTVIETALTHRLDGAVAAPVNCLVTTPVYALRGRAVLIPAGARILGETRPVQTTGETRLAVAFHRLLLPDGQSVPLGAFTGLNQIGDAGLRDQVNHHYWSTFGAAAAIGLVSGLSQAIGTVGLGGDGNRTVILAGGGATSTAQTTAQVLQRFLNRLPTVTIREGHRVKVYVTSDLDLPVWASDASLGRW